MPETCLPGDLVTESSCLQCLSGKQLLMVEAYLFSQVAGVAADPATLLNAAMAAGLLVDGISKKELLAVQASLLCQINGGTL